ncbi:MAG: glycerophosphodiester phosphodiesterase family protein [Thermoplasmatales archaeon]|jgi:glycerophosphoryl diester phosphodiesterase|nr:MAG: glycerophosphodiester phosphodiesterase family protein [Thermoplasmatales archaeon]
MVRRFRDREVLVIAHRGGGNLFSENTLKAFLGVERLGVDAVECDVQITKDGNLAVVHDSNLKRTTGIDANVRDLNSAEIKKIKVGEKENIPMLEEVFDTIHIPLVIELKSIETVNPLIKLFTRRPELLNRSVIISFFHDTLPIMKNKFPHIVCGALIAGFPIDPVSMVKQCGCGIIAINYEGLTPSYVDRCHLGGVKVSVWAPNNINGITQSLNAGVDAIGSDRPDIVIRLINSSE